MGVKDMNLKQGDIGARKDKETSSLDKLVEEFGLSSEYKERIVEHLIYSLFPTYSSDLKRIGVRFDDYIFGKPLEKLGFEVDEVKRKVKMALLEPSMAVDFHKYDRLAGKDINLFLEYIENPKPEELDKSRDGKYRSVWYPISQLMFDRDGEPFSLQFRQRLATYLHSDYAERIDRYLEDPLAIIHYLFQNENENVGIKTENRQEMPNRNPVWSEDLSFYYKSELIKKIKVIRKPTNGFETSFNAYLDIREWYETNQKRLSQILVPIEFSFDQFGMIRRFYDFKYGPLPEEARREMKKGTSFLRQRGRLCSHRTELHDNIEMSPPALIIIDFEYEGGGT